MSPKLALAEAPLPHLPPVALRAAACQLLNLLLWVTAPPPHMGVVRILPYPTLAVFQPLATHLTHYYRTWVGTLVVCLGVGWSLAAPRAYP